MSGGTRLVTDLLPAGVEVLSAPGCTVVGRLVTCPRDTIPPGGAAVVTIVVRPTAPGRLVNLASAIGTNTNLATVVQATQVLAATTLTITKTDSPDPALVGGTLTYTVAVTNTGTAPAENVILRDQLPATVTVVSASVPCALGPGNLLTCNLGTIPPGNTATVTIQVRPDAPGAIENAAVAVGANTNAIGAVATTQVILAADLAVTKTAAATGEVGVGLTFTITVINFGPSIATGADP